MRFFENNRNEGFASSSFIEKKVISELGVELSFPIKYEYDETGCEEANLEAENPFEVNYFLVVVDISISS